MGRQIIHIEARSAAPPEVVWRLLEDVTTWSDWAGFSEARYERQGDPAPHGVGAVRKLKVRGLRSTETVLAHEPPRRLAYGYRGPMPIRGYRAEVTLTPDGDGTRITWHSEFEPRMALTGPPLRALLTRVLRDISTRLARAAEAEPLS